MKTNLSHELMEKVNNGRENDLEKLRINNSVGPEIVPIDDTTFTGKCHPAVKLIHAMKKSERGIIVGKHEVSSSPLELFGIALGFMRQERQLSRIDLAERAGFDEEEIYLIELGVLPLETVVNSLPAISEGLGIEACLLSKLLSKFLFNRIEEIAPV